VIRFRRHAGAVAALVIVGLSAPTCVAAQTYSGSASPHAGSIELSGGGMWTGGYDAGSSTATETRNSTTGGTPLTLFTQRSRVAPVAGVEARAGVYLSARISVEGLFQFSRPTLRTSLRDDFENAAPIEATGGLSSYVAGGSVLYHFGSGRVVPFVAGGAGYVRQLDEDNAEVLTASEVHGGGGVKLWFGTTPRHLGVRLDAQLSVRSKAAGFEQKRRALPVVSAGLLYLF
jgi:hypothetical protein